MNGQKSKEKKKQLIERDGSECKYCGVIKVPMTIDHIIPESQQGSDRLSNLVLACLPCNNLKADLPMDQFLEILKRKEEKEKREKRLWARIRCN